MTLYFIESSALAKLFVQEQVSERLIALVEPLTQAQKLVSSLSGVEVHSAIRRRERAGDLSPALAAESLGSLAAELAQMIEQPINAAVIDTAKQLIDRYPLRALDAIQLASCCTARAATGITDIVFIASDHALLAAAAKEGLQTMDPTD